MLSARISLSAAECADIYTALAVRHQNRELAERFRLLIDAKPTSVPLSSLPAPLLAAGAATSFGAISGTMTIKTEDLAPGVLDTLLGTTPAQRYAEGLNQTTQERWTGSLPPYTFEVLKPGRVYTKIVADRGGVHAFVKNDTGEVYKAEGFSKATKDARYPSVDAALKAARADPAPWFGGYLYKRGY